MPWARVIHIRFLSGYSSIDVKIQPSALISGQLHSFPFRLQFYPY